MGFEAIIPHMTNNSAPSPFIASASNQLASYAPFNAFQDNGNAWISDVANSSIQIDLGRPYEVKKVFISSVNSWTSARMLAVTIQASGDASHWITLAVANTPSHEFTEEKDYGAFRYWRVIPRLMTARGGAISRFQLYQDDMGGFIDVKENDIWINESKDVELSGTIYPTENVDVAVEINGSIIEDWTLITGDTPVSYKYPPSTFSDGVNVIKIIIRKMDGSVKEREYLLYKLNMNGFGFRGSSYPIRIKNSPTFPRNDAYIGQTYPIKYLNSESGVSYMFKYKPYSQNPGFIQEHPSFADKIISKAAMQMAQLKHGERSQEGHGISGDMSVRATLRHIHKAIHLDGYKMGFEEAGIIQSVFESWAIIDKKDIGVISRGELARKKTEIAIDLLDQSKIPAYRRQEIQNTLTIINGYLHSSKPEGLTVVEYGKLFQEIYPYKDTIIAMSHRNASEMEFIGIMDINRPIAHKAPHIVHDLSVIQFGMKELDDGIVIEGVTSFRIPSTQDTILNDPIVADKVKRNGYDTSDLLYLGGTEIGQAILDEVLNAERIRVNQGHIDWVLYTEKDLTTKDVRLPELIALHKDSRGKESISDGIIRVDTMNIEAYTIESQTNVDLLDVESRIEQRHDLIELLPVYSWSSDINIIKVDKTGKDGEEYLNGIIQVNKTGRDVRNIFDEPAYTLKLPKDANSLDVNMSYVDLMPIDSLVNTNADYFFGKQEKDAWDVSVTIERVEKLEKDMRFDNEDKKLEKDLSKRALPIYIHQYVEKLGKEMDVIASESFTNKLDKDTWSFNEGLDYVDKISKEVFLTELDIFFDKVAKEAFKNEILTMFNAMEKGVMLLDNWPLFVQVSRDAKNIEDAAVLFVKEERKANPDIGDVAIREKKDTFVIEQLMIQHDKLNSYINELTNSFERIDEFDTVKLEEILSDKEVAKAFISESIETKRKNEEKDAVIYDRPVLARDMSEWNDIYDRYSPGVDILDPPDADYDYEKLRPLVYDVATGRPLNPNGPTNTASVYVSMPLSHPIPENNTFGVDDTKRIAVDNWIFIDCVLALESIKTRNKLRYAGMPAGKTIREVFSQLYTWIQQAAPGHEEYERMFRFMRWYAEAVSIRQSKFLLERVYNPWRSSLHNGSGLGVTHSKAGWIYNTVGGTLDTSAPSATLQFDMELMIDGEFILSGYFDNPLTHGTIEISVDGVVVDTFNTHGVFKRTVEVAQGMHTFKVFFLGLSERASISTIEISGVHFVSATTISDDSDTNGFKALTALMGQLLGYFDLHHGGNKVKGTMEIRQRAVWNTHT